jgi:hypothetical protein
MPLSLSWRQLATPGSSIEILARILQFIPALQRLEALSSLSQAAEPLQSIGDSQWPILVRPTHLTEFRFPPILSFDTDAVRAAGSRRENL